MKVFDSGMPEENYWKSLFDIPMIVRWLDLNSVVPPIVEIGCGYGTFTLPVARECAGEVHAFDIDPAMLQTTEKNAHAAGLSNITYVYRDVLASGTGLLAESVGMVLLFNILHFDERRTLLEKRLRGFWRRPALPPSFTGGRILRHRGGRACP